ncbi:MAG: endolytic transglycosylase MltG, partial [Patescibacteria group bacterium]
RVPLVVIALFLLLLFLAARQIHQYFFRSSDAPEVSFTVDEGELFTSISKRLADAGIIPSAWWFRISAKFAGLDDDIRAGTTVVIPGDRSADILGALVYPSGESEVSVTIPEGYTLAQIGTTVRAVLPDITLEEWQRVTGVSSPFITDAFVVSSQRPADVDLEGYLFPDTYRFFKNATAEDVVERMLRTMESRIGALGTPTGDAVGMTTHELLTLSSIVEREVRDPDDMDQVSDIFLKRLEIGMALQSDATVNYVTGGDDPSLSLSDRDLDSPYNTYQNPGLPPGPISNPGMNALRAVWNPAKNDYYYFLTDLEGTVYYAETHDEHVLNKALYL